MNSYRREIRKLVEENINDKFLWIGMNDRGQEGNFRLTNGTAYDVTDVNQPALYRWKSGEPNNIENNENCVHIFSRDGTTINDYQCDKDFYNYNSIKLPLYGLCELITYKCVPSK